MERDIAISVEGLGKAYRIGEKQTERYRALRDVLTRRAAALVGAPWKKKSPQTGNEPFWALKDVSFEVKRGEVVGVIGRNGAGKSTLLKILSRITEPTAGRVTLRGRVASLLEVGTGFHPELTGRENIFLSGAILGMTRWEISRKFDAIVDFAGVEPFIDTPVKRYSSGMYVRLGFAVAAHLEPEILLVDEVLAVGDAEFQKKSLGKMGEVARGGRTVLFVSHNLASIASICPDSIILHNGKEKFFGKTEQAIAIYNEQIFSEGPSVIKKGSNIEKITFFCNDKEQRNVHAGDKICIEVMVNTDAPLKNPVMGIVLKNEDHVSVIGVNNKHYGKIFQGMFKKGSVKVEIPEFPSLSPGFYYVDIFLGDVFGDREVIEKALRFKVDFQEGDVVFESQRKLNLVRVPGINWEFYAKN